MFLTIDQAGPDDLDTVLSVLDEAATWLREQGIIQWPEQFSEVDDWRHTRIQGYVKDGQAWTVRIRGEVVAVFTLGDADEHFAHGWPEGTVDDALYIYRMAVRREHAGHGIGHHILNWAATRASTLGLSWLRLDCHRDNEPLQRYYEQAGFERVGTVVAEIDPGGSTPSGKSYTRGSGALYQRPTGTVQIGGSDPYDPTGEAAVWQAASNMVETVKSDNPAAIVDPWNTALEQAARVLESEGLGIRQSNGLWYRVISGSNAQPRP